MMSPRRSPAFAAGPPAATSVTTTPCDGGSRRAASLPSGSTLSPQRSSPLETAVAGSSAGISATVTVTGTRAPSRTTTSCTGLPGAASAACRCRSGTSLTGARANSTMTSPARIPAVSAGAPLQKAGPRQPGRPAPPESHPQAVGVAQLRGGQRPGRIDLQHGEVGLRVAPDEPCGELPGIREAHDDLVSVLDDVVVRQDVSF